MILEKPARLEAEPGVDDEDGARRSLADNRPDRLVAGAAEHAVECAVAAAEHFEERILDRIERQQRPPHAVGNAARNRALAAGGDTVDEHGAPGVTGLSQGR